MGKYGRGERVPPFGGLLSRMGFREGGLPGLLKFFMSFSTAKSIARERSTGREEAEDIRPTTRPIMAPIRGSTAESGKVTERDTMKGASRARADSLTRGRKRRDTMSNHKNGNGGGKTRSGFISRLDYGDEGSRVALLEKAKEIFAEADVHFVVLAAGLIAAQAVRETIRGIKAVQRSITRQSKKLEKAFKEREKARKGQDAADGERLSEARKAHMEAVAALKRLPKDAPEETVQAATNKVEEAKREESKYYSLYRANNQRRSNDSAREKAELDVRVEEMKMEIAALDVELDKWKPESMAVHLAGIIPEFTNASGKPVRLYILPSTAFDGEEGIETVRILSELRKDIVQRPKHVDRFPIRESDDKTLEVLVPEKAVWMRGEYDATPVQRVLTDRKALKLDHPDIYVIGGFGSAMVKPMGEFPRPWVSLPALHDITGVRTSENQIGVAVMSIHPDHPVPLVKFRSLKDEVSNERSYIGYPRGCTDKQRKLIDVMKELGEATTGTLAHRTGLSDDEVTVEMQSMVSTPSHSRNTRWPGFVWDEKSREWKFPLKWLQEKLRYPALEGTPKTDSVVAYGCLHAGSVNLDIDYFLREVPMRVLDHGATVLVGAGDFVEGLAHDLAARGEVHPAFWNLTLQERLAGRMVAKVTMDVFNARFPAAIERLKGRIGDRPPTDEEIHATVGEALLQNVMIEGNHDEWVKRHGATPLIIMRSVMVRLIRKAIEKALDKHGMRTVGLDDLVERKTIILPCGKRFILPSGLKMSVDHPHMSRTKTTSIRAQAGLAQNGDAHLVVIANFHVGIAVHRWDGENGQRLALQVGTLMLDTDFEHKKQKTLDHGFGLCKLTSVNGRVIETETTFYGYRPGEGRGLDPLEPFNRMLGEHDLDES